MGIKTFQVGLSIALCPRAVASTLTTMTSSGTSAMSTRTQRTPKLSLPGIMNSEIAKKIFSFILSKLNLFVEIFNFRNLFQMCQMEFLT